MRESKLKPIFVEARDLPDLWFQAIRALLDHGRRFVIDRGSYAGQTRLELDYFTGHVHYPGTVPLLPDIPPHIGLPDPVDEAYVFGGNAYKRAYIEYLMTDKKEPGESYTYGERLVSSQLDSRSRRYVLYDTDKGRDLELYGLKMAKDGSLFLDQIGAIVNIYKKFGYRNNQMVLQVAKPTDLLLDDPPCLREIGTKIQDNKLHFFVHFRSWDAWGGLPANLAAIQTLKEYMAGEIGVQDGEMIVESKGLHIYGYSEKLAKLRCMTA